MKRISAILAALLLAAASVLSVSAVPGVPEKPAVSYTGETVDASNVSVGGTFQLTLSVSAGSGLFSGHWLLDYPEEFVSPVSASTTFSGSLTNLINQEWANGSPTSDKASFVYNLDYIGQTGDVPCGEAGNHYTSVGMYLTTFEHWGVQLGGPFIRVTFRLNSMPSYDQLPHDANGSYLLFPITVVESTYFVPGSEIAPGNDYARPHESVRTYAGKVYLNVPAPVTYHTVRFYGYNNLLLSSQSVEHGAAAVAPETPDVANSIGFFRFFEWDCDFSCVTTDLNVHADYVLLGDVDLDGSVTVADSLLALRHAMGLITLSPRQCAIADVDPDSAVQMDDSLKILRFAMGLIHTF